MKEFNKKRRLHIFFKKKSSPPPPPPENRAVYEIKWRSNVEPDRPQDDGKTRCLRIACWIPKSTYTHSEYAILIAFSLQQWLHEHASLLRYTYIACPVSLRLDCLSFAHECNGALLFSRLIFSLTASRGLLVGTLIHIREVYCSNRIL